MSENSLNLILERLNAKPIKPDHWKAHCPCHDDKTESLSITLSGSKILMHCFAGCRTEDILEAIDLTPGDLFTDEARPDREQSAINYWVKQWGWTHEATYRYSYGEYRDGLIKVKYRDKAGTKQYRWMRPNPDDPEGRYLYNRDGCRDRLYRAGDSTVSSVTAFLSEGEKDADTIYRLTGRPSYSTPDGASAAWKPEYTDQLRIYRMVIILGDNDEPGRKHAGEIARELAKTSTIAFLLDIKTAWEDIPPKGDISDMAVTLGDEKTRSFLLNAITPGEDQTSDRDPDPEEAAPDQILEPETDPPIFDSDRNIRNALRFFEEYQTETFRPIKTGFEVFDKALSGGILPKSLMILTARPGAGKTTFCQQLLETAAEHGHDVIYLNLEMSADILLAKSLSRWIYLHKQVQYTTTDILQGYLWSDSQREIISEAVHAYAEKIAPHMAYNPPGLSNDLSGLKILLSKILQRSITTGKNKAPILCLDYLHLIRSAGEETAATIQETVKALKYYALEGKTFVIAIAASNRQSNIKGQTLESARDSSSIEYTADYQIGIDTLSSDNPDQILLKILKGRVVNCNPEGIPLTFVKPYNYFKPLS